MRLAGVAASCSSASGADNTTNCPNRASNRSFTVQTTPAATPTISSVSPNPVPGSNTHQPFTIIGSNFVSGATVTLRDTTSGEAPFTNRPISSLSSTQIVTNPTFTMASHAWTVEVINPGGLSSGQFSFNVVSPDLIVQSVIFNPASVVAGNPVTVGFRIRNTGSGAAIATQARLRLSLDNNLTLNDLPLSPLDVDIPALAAGAFYDFSGTITVPSTTPPELYYVGVFADWDSRAHQSNVTNDVGLSSTQLTVNGTGVPAPTIKTQPQSQTVTAGDAVTLSVVAEGTGPFSHKWMRDEFPITGATSAILNLGKVSTAQAGNDGVLVSNSGGTTAGTTPATLTVMPNSTNLPPTVPTSGQTRCRTDEVDLNLPTIVITHGWQPLDAYDDHVFDPGHPLKWMERMANEIDLRLASEHLSPNPQGRRAKY